MSTTLESWPRTYFEPNGGDPSLFYVVYGDIDTNAPLSASKYRSQGIPDGMEVMLYGPNTHPEVVDGFREDYLLNYLRDSHPELEKVILSQKNCLVLKGQINDPENLDYLRDTEGLITYFLDNGGVGILDGQMIKWWSPDEWRNGPFKSTLAVPRHHVVILVSEEENGSKWFHTRGMRKFGRPDISFSNISPELEEGAIDLCNRFIEMMAFGALVPEEQEINMQSLPTGLKCFHRGSMDDPDFNNVHISIE